MKLGRFPRLWVWFLGLSFLMASLSSSLARAEQATSTVPVGTQTVGVTVGPFFPIRLLSGQSSKLFGEAVIPSWMVTLTDPVGPGWLQGQLALGAEVIGFHTSEPFTAYGAGFMPKLVYHSTAFGRFHPFLEGGGGPIWTDLGGRVPEQPGQFNFLVWGGAGVAYALTPHWSVQAGYRFLHISNAGTRDPNSGLNVGLPFVGFSYQAF